QHADRNSGRRLRRLSLSLSSSDTLLPRCCSTSTDAFALRSRSARNGSVEQPSKTRCGTGRSDEEESDRARLVRYAPQFDVPSCRALLFAVAANKKTRRRRLRPGVWMVALPDGSVGLFRPDGNDGCDGWRPRTRTGVAVA